MRSEKWSAWALQETKASTRTLAPWVWWMTDGSIEVRSRSLWCTKPGWLEILTSIDSILFSRRNCDRLSKAKINCNCSWQLATLLSRRSYLHIILQAAQICPHNVYLIRYRRRRAAEHKWRNSDWNGNFIRGTLTVGDTIYYLLFTTSTNGTLNHGIESNTDLGRSSLESWYIVVQPQC